MYLSAVGCKRFPPSFQACNGRWRGGGGRQTRRSYDSKVNKFSCHVSRLLLFTQGSHCSISPLFSSFPPSFLSLLSLSPFSCSFLSLLSLPPFSLSFLSLLSLSLLSLSPFPPSSLSSYLLLIPLPPLHFPLSFFSHPPSPFLLPLSTSVCKRSCREGHP